MFIRKLLLLIQMTKIVCGGMTIENYYTKGPYGVEEKIMSSKFLTDFDQMKADIDQLKQQQSDVNITDQPLFDIRFDDLPKKCQSQSEPSSCAEATACTKRSGYYNIKIKGFSNDTFLVECDVRHEGGDWTVIQRRQDGSVDFHRTWDEYKHGFGDIDGEFFIGMDKLYALTNFDGPQELVILMENGTTVVEGYAKYDAFKIGDESEKYMLKRTGRYTGTAGDSLKVHIGRKFTTKDQDNDEHPDANCAVVYTGAWWYTKCHSSNLNGQYGNASYGKGINWYYFSTHNNSLRFVKMMIRRRRN